MGASCSIIPNVSRLSLGLKVTKPSKLFKDLLDMVKNRPVTKFLYGLSKTDRVQNLTGIEYDSMGEVTATSLIDSLKLNSVAKGMKSIGSIEEELNIVDTKGLPRVMDVFSAVSVMEMFNGTDKNYIVVPTKTDEGYILQVVPRSGEQLQRAKQITFNREYNNGILSIMRELGFDLDLIDSEDFGGVFDPSTAKFAEGFIKVIQIAKGELGEEALPEEFSHLMIEGLKKHRLVSRLLDTIDPQIAMEVLGDQYQEYAEKYSHDFSRIAKEVAGKMLADKIKRGGTMTPTKVRGGLLSRAWNYAKSLFGKVSDSLIKSARDEAEAIVDKIYEGIKDRSIVKFFDKRELIGQDKLFYLKEQATNLKDMAYEALKMTAKRIRIYLIRENRSHLTTSERDLLKRMEEQYENEQYVENIADFLNDALGVMNNLSEHYSTLQQKEGLKTTQDLDMLRSAALLLRQMHEFTEGYKDIINYYIGIDDESVTARIEANSEGQTIAPRVARKLSDLASQVMEQIRKMENTYTTMRTEVVYAYMRTLFGEDKIIGLSTDSEEDSAMVLETILDHASKDISWINRMIDSMSDVSDPLLLLIKKGVDIKKGERDQEFLKLAAEIEQADKELRKAGYSSDFIFDRKPDGVPSGYIISLYDFEGYNQDYKETYEKLKQQGKKGLSLRNAIKAWKNQDIQVIVNGQTQVQKRLIWLAYDNKKPAKGEEDFEKGMWVPNPLIYTKNADRINNLPEAQKKYYETMMDIKRQMMLKIPTGQYNLYKAIYISKKGLDGIISHTDKSPGGIARAVLQNIKHQFVRRADEIDVERIRDNKKEIVDDLIGKYILKPLVKEKDAFDTLKAKVETAITNIDDIKKLETELQKIFTEAGIRGTKTKSVVQKIVSVIDEYQSDNLLVDTDFADHVIQKLPVNYMRRMKDMRDMSTDFSGAMQAFCGMAVNYSKMNEIIDLLEVTKSFVMDREVRLIENGKPLTWSWKSFSQIHNENLSIMGSESRIGELLEDYLASAVYGKRKKNQTLHIQDKDIDLNKMTDLLKNYSGTLGLGLNAFCALSNLAVGKIQQWIEIGAREYWDYKSYAKAVAQYNKYIFSYLGEFGHHVKESKMGLLIQRYDPSGEMFDELNRSGHYSNAFKNIIGNGAFMYIGMSGGEHMLRVQNMFAMLNYRKVKTKEGKMISLMDALETVTVNGRKSLRLKEGLLIEVPVVKKNKFVKIPDPNNPKKKIIKTEWVPYTEESDMDYKRVMKKVNDNLNGGFSADERGAIHRYCWGRLIMLFRQWMPKHYERRFAKSHYDVDLGKRVEGYYNTLWKFSMNCIKDLRRMRFAITENWNNLTPHEQANLRRCFTEFSLYQFLSHMCNMLGGRIKLKDADWMEKMLYYQMLRMKLEIGASMPGKNLPTNAIQILNSPMASINTVNLILALMEFKHIFQEIQSGTYKGWNRYGKDLMKAIPGVNKISLAVVFSEGMFSYMLKD